MRDICLISAWLKNMIPMSLRMWYSKNIQSLFPGNYGKNFVPHIIISIYIALYHVLLKALLHKTNEILLTRENKC